MRLIVRKLLVCIEERIDYINSTDDTVIGQLQKTHDQLFGNKLSIVANLGQVVDFLLKMGDDLSDNSPDTFAENDLRGLDDHDIALVKDFVRKHKAESAKVE